uniref:Methyl-CpG binding domain protein 1b n=1 Tax=Nothobranchius furzeri TaxID=105023 RepID=A0A8C6M978_NOTFU
MSVEGVERPQLLGSEPVGGDVGQSNTEENPEKEPAPSEGLKEIPSSTPVLLEDTPEDDKDGVKAAAGEPPVDWFEPLEEDDDAVSADLQDPDEESLAGEAESVAGSERIFVPPRLCDFRIQGYRRKRAHRDEGWMDCPSLGEGWKRKEVVRRSGSSVGQKDVYYMSPQGHRVRSRVELATVVQGSLDLSHFDFKTGMFHEGNATPFRIRQRVKVKRFGSVLRQSPAGWREETERILRTPTTDSPQTSNSSRSRPASPATAHQELTNPATNTSRWWRKSSFLLPPHPGCSPFLNCGQCANCKHGLQSPEAKKRVCRKRRCICPIRKVSPRCRCFTLLFLPLLTPEVVSSMDLDEEEMSTDDDDDVSLHGKIDGGCVSRRSCGECQACLCRRDCGTCDFCVDKPKFGGSNKKRQKCRLRQCQRQAMRHLLPFQMGMSEHVPDGPQPPGRPRPHYTYSRKDGSKRSRGLPSALDFSDNEDEDSRSQQVGITQIYSLADNPAEAGVDQENQLTQLLHSLRSSVLPILWYAIMVEGPQLQLTQCSKQSSMADTVVLIDPSFCYYITVQKQPLLPTHSIYNSFPGRLSTANEVVSLLLTLERYIVCHGLPLKELMFPNTPVVLERAATCEFLVKKNEPVCVNCRALRRL